MLSINLLFWSEPTHDHEYQHFTMSLLVHKQMYKIQMNLQRSQTSNGNFNIQNIHIVPYKEAWW